MSREFEKSLQPNFHTYPACGLPFKQERGVSQNALTAEISETDASDSGWRLSLNVKRDSEDTADPWQKNFNDEKIQKKFQSCCLEPNWRLSIDHFTVHSTRQRINPSVCLWLMLKCAICSIWRLDEEILDTS